MRVPARCTAARALLGAALVAPPVHAQAAPPDAERARAEQAFKEALADEQAGRYEKAAGELVEARALAHRDTPQLLFHLGVCHAHLGKVVLARDELRAAAERAQGGGLENVALTARAQLEQAQARVAAVTIARPAHGTLATLTLDGVDVLPRLGALVEVDPGAHVVQATFAEGSPVRVDVTLGDGQRRDVALPEQAPASTPPPPAVVAPPPPFTVQPPAPLPETPPPAASSSSHATLGWVALGGGAALVAGGAVLWVLRGNAIGTLNGECGASHQACPPSASGTISSGKLDDALGVTLFAAGGAAVLAGGGLLVFGGGGSTTTARLAPVFDARGGGIGLRGTTW